MPAVPVVISVFMLGLALGSWASGRLAQRIGGSRELHGTVSKRLNLVGVFQTWFSIGEGNIASAIAQSLATVFPRVRVYRSVEGWGLHFIASTEPIAPIDAQKMLGGGRRPRGATWRNGAAPTSPPCCAVRRAMHAVAPRR